ncbi:MAG: three-Cys-motif partner protein TcmP [Acidobacteria bacterium]|nr:three-Cys-motif partner protein TcmP [Acidobacteriota bacterium]
MANLLQFEKIGYWSELKLEILKKYAKAYSTILGAQRNPSLYHVYIDAFAGAGMNLSRTSGDLVPGSPRNALAVQPPFRDYYLIDIDAGKVGSLKKLAGEQSNVHIFSGDCNQILLKEVFPRVRFADYRRALCILDPYGLHLDWNVIQTAGQMRSIDLFLNFPVVDMNRNVLWRDPTRVEPQQIARMNRFWGDESWRGIAYSTTGNLFGYPEKEANETVAEAFLHRLREVAGFNRVPRPVPMRNSKGAVIYYLFFASQKNTAENIVEDIFEKYRRRGE